MHIVLANLIVVVHAARPCRCVVVDRSDLIGKDDALGDVLIGAIGVPEDLRGCLICQVHLIQLLAVAGLDRFLLDFEAHNSNLVTSCHVVCLYGHYEVVVENVVARFRDIADIQTFFEVSLKLTR